MEIGWLYEDLLVLRKLLYSYMNALTFTGIVEKDISFSRNISV